MAKESVLEGIQKLDDYLMNPNADQLDIDVSTEQLEEMATKEAHATFFNTDMVTQEEVDEAKAAEAKKTEEPAKTEAPAEAKVVEPTKAVEVDLDKLDEKTAEVKTEDGKHSLPFSLVKNLRVDLHETTEALEETRQTNANLVTQLKALQGAPGETAVVPTEGQTDINYEKLREDYPGELVDALEAGNKRADNLEAKLSESLTQNAEREAEAEEAVNQDIDASVDAIPELLTWKSNNDPKYDMAIAVDRKLRVDPTFQDYTFHDRFLEVVKIVQDGKPSVAVVSGQPPTPAPVVTTPAEETIEERAAKKIAAAQETAPTSLTDIPGGTPPAQSERQAVEGLSVTQLEAMLEGKTTAQEDELLARLP